jgi:hypothetical protein
MGRKRGPAFLLSIEEIPLTHPADSHFEAFVQGFLAVFFECGSSRECFGDVAVIFGQFRRSPWCRIAEAAEVLEIIEYYRRKPKELHAEDWGSWMDQRTGKTQKPDSFVTTPELEEWLRRGSTTDRCEVLFHDGRGT